MATKNKLPPQVGDKHRKERKRGRENLPQERPAALAKSIKGDAWKRLAQKVLRGFSTFWTEEQHYHLCTREKFLQRLRQRFMAH